MSIFEKNPKLISGPGNMHIICVMILFTKHSFFEQNLLSCAI